LWSVVQGSEDWWQVFARKYGLSAMKMPLVIFSQTRNQKQNKARSEDRCKTARWTYPFMKALLALGEMGPTLKYTMNSHHYNRAKWRRLRPWYKTQYARWKITPYGDAMSRTSLASVERLFAKKTIKSESIVNEIVNQLSVRKTDYQDPETGEILPQEISPNVWFWRSIGLLIDASMPSRNNKVDPTTRGPPLLFRHTDFPWIASNSMNDAFLKEIGKTKFWDALSPSPGDIPLRLDEREGTTSDRIDKLTQSANCFQTYMAFGMVPQGLETAYESEWRRIQLASHHLSSTKDWIPFNWRLPVWTNTFVNPFFREPFGSARLHEEFGELRSISDISSPSYTQGVDTSEAFKGIGRIAFAFKSQVERSVSVAKHGMPTRYFSVGQIGDFQQNGEFWALTEGQHGELDIVDLKGLCEKSCTRKQL
jgi:hypothetical protein